MDRPRITGTDNVKTSPYRQVKAEAFHILLRSSLLFLSFLLQNVNGAEDVILIFVNGNIYTANERKPRAEAIAVKHQGIVFVGSNADAKQFRGNETRRIDVDGKTIVPGFTDSHCHIFGIGEREMNLNLEETMPSKISSRRLKSAARRLSAAMGHRARLDRDFLEIFDGAPSPRNSES